MTKITVIGSINTDMVVLTDHIPAPGETLLGNSFFITGGGKGANQAVAIARMKGRASIIGKVGDDVFGRQAILNLQNEGVDTNHISSDPDLPSGVALIAVAANGENSIIVAPGANGDLREEQIRQSEELISTSDAVLLQLEIPLQTVARAIELAKKHGIKVILNPAPAAKLEHTVLGMTDVMIPNQTETGLMTGISVDGPAEAERAARWYHEKGVHTVIITMGEKGCYASDDRFSGMVPPYIGGGKAIDTVAAGDTFCGAYAVASAEGLSLETAARFANIAAALSVTRSGAQSSIPSRAETDAIFTTLLDKK